MNLPTKTIFSLRSVFQRQDYYESSRLESNLSLDSNNVFKKSLIVDLDNDEIEIPVIARTYFEKCIADNLKYSTIIEIKRIILPLYNNAADITKKTFNSIINQIFTQVNYNSRLQKVITSKGDIYYGGRGIILDKDFTPLLLCTLAIRKASINGIDKMVFYRPICHISPKVFLEHNNIMSKGIINKIIPYYVSNNIEFSVYDNAFTKNLDNKKVKVVVDNFDKFFIEPVKPTPSSTINDILNQCLIDNIDDIMMLI